MKKKRVMNLISDANSHYSLLATHYSFLIKEVNHAHTG